MPRYAAVTLCAHAPDAAICLGDSGAGLILLRTQAIVAVEAGAFIRAAPAR